MPIKIKLVITVFLCLFRASLYAQDIYELKNGNVQFSSVAPKELIHASSDNLRGIYDFQRKSFVFKMRVSSFMGFNSLMQREHFNESYMETEQYPDAVFSGKVIEDMDIRKDGEYIIRAKGKLLIHGVEQGRILPVLIKVKNGKMYIHASFAISLADYNIKIPRIINDKLASDINVSVAGIMMPR